MRTSIVDGSMDSMFVDSSFDKHLDRQGLPPTAAAMEYGVVLSAALWRPQSAFMLPASCQRLPSFFPNHHSARIQRSLH